MKATRRGWVPGGRGPSGLLSGLLPRGVVWAATGTLRWLAYAACSRGVAMGGWSIYTWELAHREWSWRVRVMVNGVVVDADAATGAEVFDVACRLVAEQAGVDVRVVAESLEVELCSALPMPAEVRVRAAL